MKKYIWIWLLAVCMAVFLWLQSVLLSVQEETVSIPLIFEPVPVNLSPNVLKYPEIEIILKTNGVNILLFRHQNIYYREEGSKLKYGMNSIHLNIDNIICSEKQIEYIVGFKHKVKMVEMDRIITSQKPVILSFSSNSDEKFFQKQKFDLRTSTVEVKGPEKLLDKLEGIKSEPVNKRDLDNNSLRVALVSPSQLIELSTREIVVRFNSNMNTIKTIPLIPIKYLGKENITFSPQKVTAKIEGKDSLLGKIIKDDIKVELIVPDDIDSIYGSLKFTMPSEVKLQEYTPEKIRIERASE